MALVGKQFWALMSANSSFETVFDFDYISLGYLRSSVGHWWVEQILGGLLRGHGVLYLVLAC